MAERKGVSILDSSTMLGSFFIGLALTVYVMSEIFKNITGLTGVANTTVEAIKTAGYGALAMAVIIGIVIVASIIMPLMRGMGGGSQ